MDDDILIFWTGAPGSKWSAASYVLNHTSKINIDISDQTPERCYIHPKKFGGIRHVGSYFGPGFEFGHKFHEINTLTKNNIKEEINKAFDGTHPEKFKIIRCHQFIYYLDWIRINFPESKIEIVDKTGQSNHYSIFILSLQFKSLPIIERHKILVY